MAYGNAKYNNLFHPLPSAVDHLVSRMIMDLQRVLLKFTSHILFISSSVADPGFGGRGGRELS